MTSADSETTDNTDAPANGDRKTDEPTEATISTIASEQIKLREDFERLAAAVTPLLTKQYQETQTRVRVLETRIRSRQERPLLAVLSGLMTDVHRLNDAGDLRDHVVDTIQTALTGFGYQTFGAVGDTYDSGWHEALAGDAGDGPTVVAVHALGLACYGDVLVKAKVDVASASSVVPELGGTTQ